jgi:UDP-N-acetylglucosamine acyltransferase
MTTPLIHPSAIIDPSVQLGSNVQIGPFCHIGPGVSIGDNTVIQSHVSIDGPTTIGANNLFYSFSCIGKRSQDLKYQVEPTYLHIGDHNVFREFSTAHRATQPGQATLIGSHNYFLSYTHIAHDCIVGNHVIFSNNGTLAGHVIVEDHVILGGLSAVHQFCRIGKYAMIGGCSKIVQDIPPYCIVDGNPAQNRGINIIGLQRHQFSKETIQELRKIYKLFFRSGLNSTQALEQAHLQFTDPESLHFINFAATTSRGLTPATKKSDEDNT